MKTIVHVIDTLGVGGAEVLLVKTIPLLKEYNNIICYLREPVDLLPQLKDYQVYNLGLDNKLNYYKAVKNLRKIIIENNASFVHAHLLWSTWVARMACPHDVKVVFTIHNLLSKDAFNVNKMSLLMEKFTYNKKHIAIGVSNEVLKDYNKYVGIKGPQILIHNFIEDNFFERPYSPRVNLNGELKLVAVGNLRRQKNYIKLLEAFTFLKDHNITLDIYGVGDLHDELQAFIENNQISVTLKGRSSNIIELLPKYDSFIMSSYFEGFPIALVEAMGIGLPLILSDITVLKDVANDKAYYFNPENPRDIADSILSIFNDWEKFRNISINNRDFIKEKVSKDRYLLNLKAIYNA